MRDPELGRGCIIPLAQAIISGLLLGVAVLAVALWFAWAQAAYISLACAAAVALWWWSSSIRSWRRYTFEEPLPEPIQVQPAAAPRVFRLEVKTGAQLQFVEFSDCSPEQLKRLAEGVLQGISFSESAWCGAGRPFSKAQFRSLRDEFIKRGWLRWKNPESVSQGVQLTGQGRAVLKFFAGADINSPAPPDYNPITW